MRRAAILTLPRPRTITPTPPCEPPPQQHYRRGARLTSYSCASTARIVDHTVVTAAVIAGGAPMTAPPTAPVQDDDAEWLRQFVWHRGYENGDINQSECDRLEAIASRLSPTPETGLVEA